MSIDLHCHTRYSDGSTPLEELIQLAALRGVTTFALTDHDTMAGCECALELGRGAGVTVIPGVEISAADPKRHGKAHILCYKPKTQAWEVIFLRFPLKHGRCRMKIVDVIPSATTI